jgi:hypothetical protein
VWWADKKTRSIQFRVPLNGEIVIIPKFPFVLATLEAGSQLIAPSNINSRSRSKTT